MTISKLKEKIFRNIKFYTVMKSKLIYLLGVFIALTVSACNQSVEEPPLDVQRIFEAKYDQAKNVNWNKVTPQEWQASFIMNDRTYLVHFTPEGKWRETKYTIEKDDIPDLVMVKLEEDFEGYKIKKAEASESPDGMYYEFKLIKNNKESDIIIDSDGIIVNDAEMDT